MRLLFVCTANICRSPTGEDVYKDQPGFEARSAGTDEDYVTVPISKELIEWADVVFCMEPHHSRKVLKLNPKAKDKVAILNIPDIYYRGHPELVKTIEHRVSKFLQTRPDTQTTEAEESYDH
jgi:predicted protein tyrosine phosphatase